MPHLETQFSSTELLPALCPPTTAICGRSRLAFCPMAAKASCSRLTSGMRSSIPRFPMAAARHRLLAQASSHYPFPRPHRRVARLSPPRPVGTGTSPRLARRRPLPPGLGSPQPAPPSLQTTACRRQGALSAPAPRCILGDVVRTGCEGGPLRGVVRRQSLLTPPPLRPGVVPGSAPRDAGNGPARSRKTRAAQAGLRPQGLCGAVACVVVG